MLKLHTSKNTSGFFDYAKQEQANAPFKNWGGYFIQTLKNNEVVTVYYTKKIKPNNKNVGIPSRYGEVIAVSPIPNALL